MRLEKCGIFTQANHAEKFIFGVLKGWSNMGSLQTQMSHKHRFILGFNYYKNSGSKVTEQHYLHSSSLMSIGRANLLDYCDKMSL